MLTLWLIASTAATNNGRRSLPWGVGTWPSFGSLRLVPELVHLLERCRLRGFAAVRKRPFYHSEAALELTICGTQHRFGIHIEMTGQIDHREKEIADLGGCGPTITRGKLALDFVCLLADLGQYREGVVPIESDLAGFGL